MNHELETFNEHMARQDDKQTVRQLRRDCQNREVSESFQKIIAFRRAFPRSKQATIKEVSERIARNVARKEERDARLKEEQDLKKKLDARLKEEQELKKELDARRKKEEREAKLADDKIREKAKAKPKNAKPKPPHLLGLAATIKGLHKK